MNRTYKNHSVTSDEKSSCVLALHNATFPWLGISPHLFRKKCIQFGARRVGTFRAPEFRSNHSQEQGIAMQYAAIERRIYFSLSKSMTFAHDCASIEERKRRSKTRRGRERTNAPRSSLVNGGKVGTNKCDVVPALEKTSAVRTVMAQLQCTDPDIEAGEADLPPTSTAATSAARTRRAAPEQSDALLATRSTTGSSTARPTVLTGIVARPLPRRSAEGLGTTSATDSSLDGSAVEDCGKKLGSRKARPSLFEGSSASGAPFGRAATNCCKIPDLHKLLQNSRSVSFQPNVSDDAEVKLLNTHASVQMSSAKSKRQSGYSHA